MHTVQIVGNEVQLTDTTILGRMDLKAFIDTLTSPQQIVFGPLPIGTRYYAQIDRDHLIVLEHPPGIRSLSRMNNYGNIVQHQIALPWSYFFIYFHHDGTGQNYRAPSDGLTVNDNPPVASVRVYWRNERSNNPTADRFWAAKLPNIDQSGWACLGHTDTPRLDSLDSFVDWWYQQPSNEELEWNRPEPYTSFRQWELASKANPLLGLEFSLFAYSPSDRPFHEQRHPTLDTIIVNDQTIPITAPMSEVLVDLQTPARALPTPELHASCFDCGWTTSHPDDDGRCPDCAVARARSDENAATGTCNCACGCDNDVYNERDDCGGCDDGNHENATNAYCEGCDNWTSTRDVKDITIARNEASTAFATEPTWSTTLCIGCINTDLRHCETHDLYWYPVISNAPDAWGERRVSCLHCATT